MFVACQDTAEHRIKQNDIAAHEATVTPVANLKTQKFQPKTFFAAPPHPPSAGLPLHFLSLSTRQFLAGGVNDFA